MSSRSALGFNLVEPVGDRLLFTTKNGFITTKFSGSKIKYMQPKKISVACTLTLNTPPSPGVPCALKLTAVKDGKEVGVKYCTYLGMGPVAECDLTSLPANDLLVIKPMNTGVAVLLGLSTGITVALPGQTAK